MATILDLQNSSPTDEGDLESERDTTTFESVGQRPRRGRGCFGTRQRRRPTASEAAFDVIGVESNHSSLSSLCSDAEYRRTSSSSSTSIPGLSNSATSSSEFCLGLSGSSSNITSRREVPPLRPSKKNHRRSLSLCPPDIPRPVPLAKRSSTCSYGTSASLDSALHAWKENQPNVADFSQSPPSVSSQRRKVKAQRRSSMSCSVPVHKPSVSVTAFSSRAGSSLSNLTSTNVKRPSTIQMCRRASIGSFPTESSQLSLFAPSSKSNDAWMNQVSNKGPESPPKRSKLSRFDSEELTDYTDSSPGTPSMSVNGCSTRKRGMSEEPSEDPDDSSSIFSGFSARRTTYANNSASRSCTPKHLVPPPPLEMDQGTISNAPIQPTSSTKNEYLEQTGRRRVTDFYSDSSEADDSEDSDYSMSEDSDDEGEPAQKRDTSQCANRVRGRGLALVDTEEEILDSMTSIDDIKFLITTLRRQNSSCTSLTVIPPQKWIAERRSNFIEWAETKLGFSVRQSDPTSSYLVIHQSKGRAALNVLESASDMYKAKKHEEKTTPAQQKGFAVGKPPIILDTASDMSAVKEKPSRSVVVPSLGQGHGDVTDNVVAHLDSLSLKEKDTPLVRKVTIDGNETYSRLPSFQPDLSPPVEAPPRLSLDSRECYDDDLSFIFGGHTPARPERLSLSKRRPPKSSIGSVNSALSIPKRMDITPMNVAAPSTAPSAAQPGGFDFVTTPLMKQPAQAWGSRPIDGMDWGCSEECEKGILDDLMILCNDSCEEANITDTNGDFPGTANLQLDLEVEAGSEDEESYDDSDEETDGFTMIEKDVGINSLEIPNGTGCRLRDLRRRNSSLQKKKRMSVCFTAAARRSYIYQRKPMFDPRQSLDSRRHRRGLSIGADCFLPPVRDRERLDCEQPLVEVLAEKGILTKVFRFLEETELLTSVSLVCSSWSDASTDAYAELMIASVGCTPSNEDYQEDHSDVDEHSEVKNSIAQSMERSWGQLMTEFPYASFLSEGSFKRVYKVKNAAMKSAEAVSIMDVDLLDSLGQREVVATELAVSVMLSSLSRRGICPNFIVTRGVFTCPFEPPVSHWGCAEKKNHEVHVETPKGRRRPRQPAAKHRGNFQYIRMELCTEGDAEEYIKKQPNEMLPVEMSRILLFQTSFALHAAASKYSLKHYDMKLLNIFLQDAAEVPGAKTSATGDIVLRYGLGSKNFALRMPSTNALLAKVADYGTADVKSESNGQPVSLAQLTTLENTPPDFLILGDAAKQGHAHDLFGLGLCMLHLFTGKAPYEEILCDVKCPDFFKELLRALWEHEGATGYSVIRGVILNDVFEDDEGNIEGEPDETFYDTLYRFLVLFGIPEHKFQQRKHGKVWKAISESLTKRETKRGKATAKQFKRDQGIYALARGTNKYIARARRNLESMTGGMELLKSLVNFDPEARATALDVLNSDFFAPLKELPNTSYRSCDDVRSFTALAIN